MPATMAADGSVGIVTPETVTLFSREDPLHLECGATLGPLEVAYETYGTLNADRSNAVLVLHALSGSAHLAGRHHASDRKSGWWDTFVGSGRPFDTDRYFIICTNNLGGCYGSTGPSSLNPETGRPYGLSFPLITIGDMARVQKAVLDHLGITTLMAVVGGSMGGQIALQWALDFPRQVPACVMIASTPRLTAQNIAFNAVARQAIMMDPHFNNGDYYDKLHKPANGLALARMMAHITYLSEQGLHDKFGRRLQDRDELSFGFETDFAVESYLYYQGSSFVKRFDANTYLYITKAMDYFDPFPTPETAAARLQAVHSRFYVCSFDTDWRFDTSRSKELVKLLNWNRKEVTFQEFKCPYGHDAFLMDIPEYKRSLSLFLERQYLEITGQVEAPGGPREKRVA